VKQLYFIRHGESELNVQRIFAGHLDTPLTARGREQAAIAGKRAKDMSFDLIVSSPLRRALETAQIVAQAVGYPLDKIVVNDIFKERSFGTLEGKSWDEHEEAADDTNGVETDDSLLARAQQGLAFLQGLSADTILLVGHGSFSHSLRIIIDPDGNHQELPNAQIIRLI